MQILTGCLHSVTLFVSPKPANTTEKQLFDLMDNYHFDFGSGFTPTMGDLMTSFSISLSLFLLFAGVMNLVLLQNRVAAETMDHVIRINTIFFGLCLLTMIFMAFLVPIVCLALIVLALMIANITLPKNDNVNTSDFLNN
ncbi:hypothetical protein [Flavobacterium sp. GT3R68]|uniref:LIC_13387 family protein n=1 Tax=Flavobacterium sp. GT3R68 TaxID=2594437 RepID=UPI000F8689D6|nr:hypothetical protein [Flavobacterium sp. GT3R68]RTY93682.1 hypothetical protein EKL32_15265 [Flavobacterium sp. GSN2]TRW91596.1 hypothetical protein FNW07_06820 [Flavobacterium sp. GT3R68]